MQPVRPVDSAPPHPAPELIREQNQTLATPRRRYGILAKILFVMMDVIYGKGRTLAKFRVLELIARVPYQTWEHVGYIAVTHKHGKPRFARRVFDFVQEARAQQDNEQWHLLILEEMLQQRGIRQGFLRFRLIPQVIAFAYYHVSWLLYVVNPALSYGLNADFEDHAEHEYMLFVRDTPQFENEPFVSEFEKDYGAFASVADMLRQIGLDERMHKIESEQRMLQPRFA